MTEHAHLGYGWERCGPDCPLPEPEPAPEHVRPAVLHASELWMGPVGTPLPESWPPAPDSGWVRTGSPPPSKRSSTMALATVTTVTGVEGPKRYVPLCSCGWEGTKTTVSSDAYREKSRHQREAHTARASCGHDEYRHGRCAEMSCRNYAGKAPNA